MRFFGSQKYLVIRNIWEETQLRLQQYFKNLFILIVDCIKYKCVWWPLYHCEGWFKRNDTPATRSQFYLFQVIHFLISFSTRALVLRCNSRPQSPLVVCDSAVTVTSLKGRTIFWLANTFSLGHFFISSITIRTKLCYFLVWLKQINYWTIFKIWRWLYSWKCFSHFKKILLQTF